MVTAPGRGELLRRRTGFARGSAGNAAGGLLDVRCVATGLAIDHVILAGLGRHHEFVGQAAADDAGVGLDGESLQTTALEDARVGIVHLAVAGGGRLVADIEAVGVLHDELARAHQTEARADFVAELDLDLVEIFRELAVGADLVGGERGDDLLVRGAEHPFALRVVAHLEEHITRGLVAPGLLPDFGRLQRGHEDFERAGAVHLLADDALDLAQRAQTERQKGVHAACEFAQQAGAEQEFVGKDLRLGGGFLQGGNEGLRPTHKIKTPGRLMGPPGGMAMKGYFTVFTKGARP